MIDLKKANLFLKLFGMTKVRMIGYCRPKLLRISEDAVEVKIRLNRRTRNHLNSMYLGVLNVGADLAGGVIAMMLGEIRKMKVSLAFKGMTAEYIKRPEADVHFICEEGGKISDMLNRSKESGERINEPIAVRATCPSVSGEETIAEFSMVLSLKVK